MKIFEKCKTASINNEHFVECIKTKMGVALAILGLAFLATGAAVAMMG